MYSSMIQISVQDFDTWREVFDSYWETRESFGCVGERILQDTSDPNKVVVILDWDSIEDARSHAQSPELRQAMQEAGVVGPPITMMTLDVS